MEKIKEVFEKIKSFDPKPGRNYESDQTIYVVPDVSRDQGRRRLRCFPQRRRNSRSQDEPLLRELCAAMKKLNGDTKEYIKKKIKQAEWFMKSLQQRQRTLYLVAKSIVDFQKEFFEKGIRCI